jgi:hypothetical protein
MLHPFAVWKGFGTTSPTGELPLRQLNVLINPIHFGVVGHVVPSLNQYPEPKI